MGRRLVPRYLATLDVAHLTDTDVHEIVGNIKLVAPKSAIVTGNQALLASLDELDKRDKALGASNQLVADDRQKLRTDLGTEAEDRSDLHAELRTFVSLAQGVAKSPADLVSAGLHPAPPRPPKNQPPEVPQQIDNLPPKKGHGKTVVSVHETGSIRHHYVAEQSLDGVTWTQLGVGHGKTRTVTGASGTKVWVRFAMVRGQLQSDWSVPILVTIP